MAVQAQAAEGVKTVLVAERPRMLSLARRLVWNDEDALDVVQSAYADAMAQWRGLADAQAAPAWLKRIVVNRALSLLRKRKVVRAVTSFFSAEPEPVPTPDEAATKRQHLLRLGRALEKLPPRQAAAFSLRYLEGQSIDEVADALGIDRGTVRVHLQRAVATLRAQGVLEEGGAR